MVRVGVTRSAAIGVADLRAAAQAGSCTTTRVGLSSDNEKRRRALLSAVTPRKLPQSPGKLWTARRGPKTR